MSSKTVSGESRIAEVSERLGVPVPTIRSWERRYGFPRPIRTDGKHRRYAEQEIEQLRLMRDLITTGYSARDAADRIRSGAATSAGGAEVHEFVAAALQLDPSRMRRVLDTAAERRGVDLTIRDVLMPAMSRIGSAWKAGTCEVEHEHLATDTVRAWLGRQGSMAPAPFLPHTIVLACGPKDLHTVGLEAFALLLARRGWSCRTLGALTPADRLRAATVASNAAAVVVTSQRAVTRRSAVQSLTGVAWLPGVTAFYAGDGFASPASRANIPGTYLGTDVLAAAEILGAALSPSKAG